MRKQQKITCLNAYAIKLNEMANTKTAEAQTHLIILLFFFSKLERFHVAGVARLHPNLFAVFFLF